MHKLTLYQKQTAARIARDAISADERGNGVICGQAISELWGIIGYWVRSKQLTTAEYRGESVPPKMMRMPVGRSVPWKKRWEAVKAWAEFQGDE